MSTASQTRIRGSGIRRRGWALGWSAALIAFASSAMAAEIVEVRVGRHPEFTRVVFELDRAAGYRIERDQPAPDISELVVSLEATSIPRRIRSSSALVGHVEIEPTGGRSVARIRLGKGGLRLKEMILANPPRIVLDVLTDQPVVAKAAAKPKPKPKAKPAPVRQVEPEPVVAVVKEVVVEEVPEPVVVVEEEPDPSSFFEEDPVLAAADSAPTASEAARAMEAEASAEAAREMDAAADFDEAVAMAEAGADAGETAAADAAAASAGDAQEEDAAAKALAAMAKRSEPKPIARPMVAQSSDGGSGGGWMMWALVGVGAIALVAGGVFVARRRRGEVDYEDDASADGSDGSGEADANPFANLAEDGEQLDLAPSDESTLPGGLLDDADATVVSVPQDSEEKESESVVFDSEEESTMEVMSRDEVNESLGGEMPPAMGGIPEEFQQMMREMDRRVQSLEGRIDELVDARDRLERQVAAQTEELRVQRAAIARTQRAVRNLGRGDEDASADASAEEHATEPALRDPNKPSSE